MRKLRRGMGGARVDSGTEGGGQQDEPADEATPGSSPMPGAVPRPRKLWLLRWLPGAWMVTARPRGDRNLYLTFDDGPHPEHTPRILDFLAKHGIRATFFLVGKHAEAYPALVRRIVGEGHALGNHSYTHDDYGQASLAEQLAELDRTDRILADFDGLARHDFRPPRGRFSPLLLLRLALARRRIAYWSYDSLDYSQMPAEHLVALGLRYPPRGGDIVLMHDDHVTSLRMLEQLLPRWREAGYSMAILPAVS